jgi:hypothetical protein
MNVIEQAVIRGWENFLARPGGHFGLRFYMQPAMASLIALRAGLRDAREHRPAYLAVVPYVLLRGPISRLARLWS